MGNIIRMDIYRLVTSVSFKVCLGIVFFMNLLEGPVSKLIFNLGKMLVKDSDDSEGALEAMEAWAGSYHVGNLVAGQLGTVCTVVFLLCVVYFCFADIQHGYIKNIAGQLPSRGHTIVSKFVVIQFTILTFYAATVIGNIVGQLLVGRKLKFDMYFSGELDIMTMTEGVGKTFSMGQALCEFAIKFLLLSGMCSLILLLTTGIGSNVAGTIVAVLCGAGFTGLAYSGISAGIRKLFHLKKFTLTDYMPDSLYRTDLYNEDCVVRALIMAILTIVILMVLTTRLYNKKDIK